MLTKTFSKMFRVAGLFATAVAVGMVAGCGECGQDSGAGSAAGAAKTPHVLILGLDGLRRDALELAIKNGDVPNMAKLAATGAGFWGMEAGGDLNGATRQPTISGPGWATIVTGVFLNKHGVPDNNFKTAHFDKYPHFFKYVRDAKPDACLVSVCSWAPVNEQILQPSGENLADVCHCSAPAKKGGDIDADTRDKTVAALTEKNPDAVFVHIDGPDHTGHAYGYGPHIPQYMACLKVVDGYIGDMLGALEKRPGYAGESWLIILTTDHGGKGKGHGGQSPEEREIVTIFSGAGFEKGKRDDTLILQDVITPTALKHLGIAIKPEWDLEHAPLN